MPERPGLMGGELNEHNLQDVVDLVSNDMKTGILSIRSPKGVLEGMPVIVETERASAHRTELILDGLTIPVYVADDGVAAECLYIVERGGRVVTQDDLLDLE